MWNTTKKHGTTEYTLHQNRRVHIVLMPLHITTGNRERGSVETMQQTNAFTYTYTFTHMYTHTYTYTRSFTNT